MSSSGRDPSGRQGRLHGAFTGGFSAGFYNSVGSAQGWNPTSFSSSRSRRATIREQRPEDFMDEQDGLLTEQLEAKAEFDTLGFTASQVAKRHAKEAKAGAIPGPAPSELIMPLGDSMGRKLLRTMGWREGQGVGRRKRRRRSDNMTTQGDDSSGEELSEQARAGLGERAKALIEREGLTFAPDNAAIGPQVIVPRSTYHGVGYDPFRNMPEFSSARVAQVQTHTTRGVLRTKDLMRKSDGNVGVRTSSELESSLSTPYITRGTHGFALDDGEDDVYDFGGNDVLYQSHNEEIVQPGIDSRLVRSAREWASNTVDGEGEPPSSHRSARCPSDGRLPPAGFVVAQLEEGRSQFWSPPKPPEDFHPAHKFEDLEPLESMKGKRVDMDSSRRAQLLGEPNREVGHDLFAGASESVKDFPKNSKDGSVFSLLPPSARQKLAEATRSLGNPSTGVSSMKQSLGIMNRSKAEATPGFQGDAGRVMPNLLASKFTSENGHMADSSTGLRPAARPAGLSLGKPGSVDGKVAPSYAVAPLVMRQTSNLSNKPSRSTLTWRPAPLLCKRLNVPVPAGSLSADRTSEVPKDEPTGYLTYGAVTDSSLTRGAKKVPLLKGIDEKHGPGEMEKPQLSVSNDGKDYTDTQRPAIDLFKSIFESDSGSETSSESESHRVDGDLGDMVSDDPAVSTSLSGPLTARETKERPQTQVSGADLSAEGHTATGGGTRVNDFLSEADAKHTVLAKSVHIREKIKSSGASNVRSSHFIIGDSLRDQWESSADSHLTDAARAGLESDSTEHSFRKEIDAHKERSVRHKHKRKEKSDKKLKKHRKRRREKK